MAPPYPTTLDAIAYVEQYRLETFCKSGNPKSYQLFEHNRYIYTKATGGLNNYFIAYAWPPGGFWYAYITELSHHEPWRAWIFLYHPEIQTYETIIYTPNDGLEAFMGRRRRLGL